MLSNSINWLVASAILAMCLSSIGCCGPQGCGVGCGALEGGCNDCDGAYYGSRPAPYGPIDQLRQFKKSLVCGGGCGETYYGEWRSTPPDVADPCCGDQFVGGATKCTPFCSPDCSRCGLRGLGSLAAGLYGRRFCDGSESCGCEVSGGCDTCSSAPIYGGETIIPSGPVSGCSTCDARNAAGSTRVASQQYETMTEQQWAAHQQMQQTQQQIQDSRVRTARAATTSGQRMYR